MSGAALPTWNDVDWARMPSMSRCFMHNPHPDDQPRAEYQMLLPIGNAIPLCAPCCTAWRSTAAANPDDPWQQPVAIRSLRSAGLS